MEASHLDVGAYQPALQYALWGAAGGTVMPFVSIIYAWLLPAQSTLTFERLLARVCAPAPIASVCAGSSSTYVLGTGGELL